MHLTLTGSEVHFWSTFTQHADAHPITSLNDKTKFDAKDRYQVSKLLNVFLARKLAALAGDSVVVNVVNPGLCHSELARSAVGIARRVCSYLARGWFRLSLLDRKPLHDRFQGTSCSHD